MSHLPTSADKQPPSGGTVDTGTLARDIDRLADRFRHLGESRLRAAAGGRPSRAAAGRELAQRLADLAAAVEAPPGTAPVARRVPDDGPFAVGDQIAVTGHDLLAALAARPGDGRGHEVLLVGGGTAGIGEIVRRADEAVREVRALA
jgi:hypothetical protein